MTAVILTADPVQAFHVWRGLRPARPEQDVAGKFLPYRGVRCLKAPDSRFCAVKQPYRLRWSKLSVGIVIRPVPLVLQNNQGMLEVLARLYAIQAA